MPLSALCSVCVALALLTMPTVQAVSATGAGEWSRVIDHRTSSSEPGPCTRLRTEHLTLTSISLAWAAADDNGSPITQYHVEVAAMPNSLWQPLLSCEGHKAVATNLLANDAYSFRVRAENAVRTCPSWHFTSGHVVGCLCIAQRRLVIFAFESGGSQLEGVHAGAGLFDMQRGVGPWNTKPPMARTVRSDAATPARLAHVITATCTSAIVQWCRCQDGEEEAKYEAQLSAVSPYARKHLIGSSKGRTEEWQTVYLGLREICEVKRLQAGCNYTMRVRHIINGCTSTWSKTIPVRNLAAVAHPVQVCRGDACARGDARSHLDQCNDQYMWPRAPSGRGLLVGDGQSHEG